MINKIWKITLTLSILIIITLLITFILTTNINFQLKGNQNININVNQKYEEQGYIATVLKKDITNKVTINSSLNTSIVGTYKIEYNLTYLGKKYTLQRIINVIDNEIPSITLNGEEEIILTIDQEYKEQGATAFDNYDKDITSQIKVESNLDLTKEGNYQITYAVTDSSGNQNSITRKINVIKKQEPKVTQEIEIYNDNNPIIKYIKENNYDVSIGYYNLITKEEVYYQENKIYYGASLIKTLDAIYLYDNNLVTEEIKDYIKKAIEVSDNTSHYYLINYIGKNNLKNYGISLGAYNTLNGNDSYGNTTVKDQIIYLKKLYEISKNNEELKTYFINDYGNYLKLDNLTIMHKYGYYANYYHDVGIVLDDNPYIVVILTNHGNKNEKEVINNLSKIIYNYHKNH